MRPFAAVLFATLLALSACASPAQVAAEQQARLDRYRGMTEAELVRALGQPTAQSGGGEHVVLVYHREMRQWVQASPFNGTPPELLGLDYNGLPPILRVWTCETTFDLAHGAVVAARQRGNYCSGVV